jgi:hypothetical protein
MSYLYNMELGYTFQAAGLDVAHRFKLAADAAVRQLAEDPKYRIAELTLQRSQSDSDPSNLGGERKTWR